jgi:chromosome segregation ATPase
MLMFKKLLLVGGVVVVGLMAVKGTRFFGYMKNEVASARLWLDEQVPVEKEIARLRGEVAKLDKDIAAVKDELAKELYATEKQQKDTLDMKAKLEAEKRDLHARLEKIREAGDATHISFGSDKQTMASAQKQLASDSKLWQLKSDTLSKKQDSLSISERNVAVLQKQLAELQKQKSELKLEIDGIEADYKALKLQQMETKYHYDDSRLSKVKTQIHQLKDRLAVQQKRVDLDKADGTIKPSAPVESLDEIEARLNNEKK